jgi:hypothetical protein
MLKQLPTAALAQIVGIIYINPFTSPQALRRIRRFVREHARGHHRWGKLYQYPMIEFDDVDDLTAVRKKFVRLIDGYKDLSDCPEQAD